MTLTTSRKVAAIVASTAALALVPAAANAADPTATFRYDANGTTVIKKPNTTIKLGPTKLDATLNLANGNFTGSLPIPKTSTEFKAFGFAPVKADVSFVPVGKVTGVVDFSGLNAFVDATARYNVKLSNIKIGGFPTFPGPFCQTKSVVSIPVKTPAGEGFDLALGGNLEGTYTLPEFQNCGINTPLINSLVPGPGNTVKFTVSNGTQIS